MRGAMILIAMTIPQLTVILVSIALTHCVSI